MKLIGLDSILTLTTEEHFLFKAIVNESGAVFFPHSQEHRDATQFGIRYADNYEGNALAAMIKPGRIEFRFHKQFSDDRVRKIASEMLTDPLLSFAAGFSVTYQNRLLINGNE